MTGGIQLLRVERRDSISGGLARHVSGALRPDTALPRNGLEPVVDLLGNDAGVVLLEAARVLLGKDRRSDSSAVLAAAGKLLGDDVTAARLHAAQRLFENARQDGPDALQAAAQELLPEKHLNNPAALRLQLARQLVAEKRAERKAARRRGPVPAAYADIIACGPPHYADARAWTEKKVRDFGDATLKFLRTHLPHSFIVQACIHQDEAAPHIQYALVPIGANGVLGWNAVRDDLPGGSHRARMQMLQDLFHEDVAGHFGLERGQRSSRSRGAPWPRRHQPVDRALGREIRIAEETGPLVERKQALAGEIEEAEKKLGSRNDEIDDLGSQKRARAEEVRSLNEQAQRLHQQQSEMDEEGAAKRQTLATELDRLKSRKTNLAAEIETAEVSLGDIEEAVAHRQEDLQRYVQAAEKQTAAIDATAEETAQRNRELMRRHEELAAGIKQLESRRTEIDAEVHAGGAELSTVRTRLDEALADSAAAQEKKQRLDQEIQTGIEQKATLDEDGRNAADATRRCVTERDRAIEDRNRARDQERAAEADRDAAVERKRQLDDDAEAAARRQAELEVRSRTQAEELAEAARELKAIRTATEAAATDSAAAQRRKQDLDRDAGILAQRKESLKSEVDTAERQKQALDETIVGAEQHMLELEAGIAEAEDRQRAVWTKQEAAEDKADLVADPRLWKLLEADRRRIGQALTSVPFLLEQGHPPLDAVAFALCASCVDPERVAELLPASGGDGSGVSCPTGTEIADVMQRYYETEALAPNNDDLQAWADDRQVLEAAEQRLAERRELRKVVERSRPAKGGAPQRPGTQRRVGQSPVRSPITVNRS